MNKLSKLELKTNQQWLFLLQPYYALLCIIMQRKHPAFSQPAVPGLLPSDPQQDKFMSAEGGLWTEWAMQTFID